jgi:isopentenyl phosphate kinase
VVAPVIVKLGGSVLTRKRAEPRVRRKVLARLASELASVHDVPIILLHGAGSFGHPAASRWRLAEAPEDGEAAHRPRGAAVVSAEVRGLHGAVLAALLEAHANPWSVPASTHATNDGGKLIALDDSAIRTALGQGLMPVSFGDVVPDRSWGFSILSADTIAVRLAKELGARRVLFVSDVPGVLRTGPPGRPVVEPVLTSEVVSALKPGGGGPDVTGGIRGKAQAMLAIAEAGADAALISGLQDGSLSRALRGENVYGSWAYAASR